VSGGSEGAWVAAEAAAISTDVRWVLVSGFSGHPIPESIAWRVGTIVRMDGRFTSEQADQAAGLRRLFNRALFDNRGWEPLRQGIERWGTEPWFSLARVPARLPAVLDTAALGRDPGVVRERRYEAFDPDSAWSRVRVPVLFLAGGHDRSAASIETWPRIEAALRRAGNTRYTLRTFPSANHEGFESETGADEEYPRLHRYAPGYFEQTLQWLRDTLGPIPATRLLPDSLVRLH
jgi:pimeloyl-ACP methyl ester carboxylesterase